MIDVTFPNNSYSTVCSQQSEKTQSSKTSTHHSHLSIFYLDSTKWSSYDEMRYVSGVNSCGGWVVKAMDLWSIGVSLRRFESCPWRLFLYSTRRRKWLLKKIHTFREGFNCFYTKNKTKDRQQPWDKTKALNYSDTPTNKPQHTTNSKTHSVSYTNIHLQHYIHLFP